MGLDIVSLLYIPEEGSKVTTLSALEDKAIELGGLSHPVLIYAGNGARG